MTLPASYSDALDVAYSGKTPDSVIGAVKQVIINQLREMDSRVEIESTDFFNHSFAPDFVLHWKTSSIKREVYVRQSSNDPYFSEDIALLVEKSPVVFSLEPTHGRMRVRKETEIDARRGDTLLTDAPGLHEITERRAGSKVLDVASPSILQGGRGVLDEATADSVASGISRGFLSAAALSLEETRETVALFRYFFKSSHAARLTQFLRAVWIGAGGAYEDFPSDSHLDRELSPEALSFLLQIQDRADLHFWRRVGYGLSIGKLGSLEGKETVNFERLILANFDRIQARAAQASDPVEKTGDRVDRFGSWSSQADCLVWSGSSGALTFVEAKRALTDAVDGDEPNAVPLVELLERARRHQISLENLELESNGRLVSYGASPKGRNRDISLDDELLRLIESLGPAAVVRRAAVTLANSRALTCDFETSVAAGRAGAKYSLLDLLRSAAPLLIDLSDTDSQALARLIADHLELVQPIPLF
ncbi:hypothetical protein GCM10009836_61530 [Pseudonocardia ailaonensis]|uniref:Uncharacterized protein n=1 Tax=Pseudonocardia ailaonensis TaxID=367279 RepID=A0ABN2NKW9_9PSEU